MTHSDKEGPWGPPGCTCTAVNWGGYVVSHGKTCPHYVDTAAFEVLTGVRSDSISASHKDRLTGLVHGHTYFVKAWHECPDGNDAVVLQNHLRTMCAAWDHTTLPDELARGEDWAIKILRASPPTCVEVEIMRDGEGLYAKARLRR
jgi:hypothetical protein